jgi:predicted metal-binding membrane protein
MDAGQERAQATYRGHDAWIGGAGAALALLPAAITWAATVAMAGHLGAMAGTMGLDLGGFLGVWTFMMAAMMLPSVTPLASRYAGSLRGRRAVQLTGFGTGYVLVWAAASVGEKTAVRDRQRRA